MYSIKKKGEMKWKNEVQYIQKKWEMCFKKNSCKRSMMADYISAKCTASENNIKMTNYRTISLKNHQKTDWTEPL